MSKVTADDLKKVREPCRSCDLTAQGRGKNKEIWCNKQPSKLMGEGNPFWYEIPDCPLKAKNETK